MKLREKRTDELCVHFHTCFIFTDTKIYSSVPDLNSWGHSLLKCRCPSPAERGVTHQEEKQTRKMCPQSWGSICSTSLSEYPSMMSAFLYSNIHTHTQDYKKTTKTSKNKHVLTQYILRSQTCGLASILPVFNSTQQVGPTGEFWICLRRFQVRISIGHILLCLVVILRHDGNV